MKNSKEDIQAEGCANMVMFGVFAVVMIPLGFLMSSLGATSGFIIGVTICVLLVMLTTMGNKK